MVYSGYNVSVYDDKLEDGKNTNVDETNEEEEDVEAGLCCFGGCLTGCSLCLLLVIIFPAGILLSIYATSNKEYDVLAAGIILVVFPLILIPIVVAIYLNRRRIRRIRKRKVADKHVQKPAEKF